MSKTVRVLTLLEALQDRPSATGPQLATRLGVDVRTVRRDVVALQDLGIPVEAERGPAGGYRLRPGFRVPPLMLTDTEAAIVALGLIAARRDGLDADAVLAKIRRVLPDAARLRVDALEQTLRFTTSAGDSVPPDVDQLGLLAQATLRGRRVTAHYTTSDGAESEREVSPLGVIAHGGRWYVPAHDHGRGELRTLRADRFERVRIRGRGEPAPPGFDPVDFVERALANVPWTHAVEVLLHVDVDTARRRFPRSRAELDPAGEATTRLRMRADSLDWVATLLAGSGFAFTVAEPDALRAAVRELGERLVGYSSGTTPAASAPAHAAAAAPPRVVTPSRR